jgi:imidazolonepropionase-like amidohydrolase
MRSILFALFFLLAGLCMAQSPVNSSTQDIVFRSVNVISMTTDRVLTNQDVLVRDGIIVSMGNAGTVPYSQNALRINAKGKYLMPGLAEMHAHVPPINDLAPMQELVCLFALKGVTTIRGMLGHPLHLELRNQINRGELLSPRFYTSGPSLNGNSVKSAAAGAQMVRQQKEAGYDFLKLHPGLTPETFGAIAQTAKEVGIPFAGHVSYEVGVWRAIEAGYASIDHLDGFIESLIPGIDTIPEQHTGLFAMFVADQADESRIPKLMEGLRENNIWVVPTQALAERWIGEDKDPEVLRKSPEMIYMAPETLDKWVKTKKDLMALPQYNASSIARYNQLRRKLILECSRNGVGLLLGSDAPQVFNVPGFSTHQELQYLVQAGLTPYEALRTGTYNVGRYLNRADVGVIQKGAVADLLLLNGNPLQDISQTQNIEGVLVGKQWLSKAYIKQELKKLEKR